MFLVIMNGSVGLAQQNVLTQQYDNSRAGQNTNETILTPTNVNTSQFGKYFSQPVDGYIYAQPLYVSNVTIPGKGVHNVVYVATEGNSVYAFDANSISGTNAAPLWMANLIDTGHGVAAGVTALTVSTTDVNCTNIKPQYGVTSTPVIDLNSGTMYVVAKSKENGLFVHRLHALDIATGNEKSPGAVVLTATVPGTGDGSSNGQVLFGGSSTAGQTMAKDQLNRPGLLLTNGIVYIGFGSHCDHSPYHGWVFAYDTATLTQQGVWLDTPNGGLGGVWTSGAGLAADSNNNVYVTTGNGTFDTTAVPATELGDSIVKLALSGGNFSVLDYFTPYNQASLKSGDIDVGSAGVVLLPDQPGSHPHLLVQNGKPGTIYLIDRDQMTANNQHYCNGCNSDPQVVQAITGADPGLYGNVAYWNGMVYTWGSGPAGGAKDTLKAYQLSNGLLSTTPVSSSADLFGFPGATPTISANGNANGIVWALQTDGAEGGFSARLNAYDATNVATRLYSTADNFSRDDPGPAVKFAVPTVVNGQVYVGAEDRVTVYGLLANFQFPAATPVITPGPESVSTQVTVTITDATPGATIYYTLDGSMPSPTNGTQYVNSFVLTSSATVTAMAVATGFAESAFASVNYTIQPTAASSINYSTGMSATGLTLNGSAKIVGSLLSLTDGALNEQASAYSTTQANVQTFNTDFMFQLTNPLSDGFTFVIQASGVNALGPSGGGLGYGSHTTGGIPKSVAVKFDLYNNIGEGPNSTGIYTNGASPELPAVNLEGTGIDLHSGHIHHVHMAYDGANLVMTITDTSSQFSFSHTFPIDIPGTVGGPNAFVGFTGSTGGSGATQDILSWSYVSGPAIQPLAAMPTFNPPGGTVTSTQPISITDTTGGASIYYTTDGVTTPTVTPNELYTGPFTLAASTTVKAMAVANGFSNSAVASVAFTVLPPAAMPTLNPQGGTVTSTQPISITDTTGGASIYYTTDGVTTPTVTPSELYTGPFTLAASTTVKAMAVANGFSNSAVASVAFTVLPPAAMPTFNPQGGTVTSTQQISITDATGGASIYYTTDGVTTPTVTPNELYTGPFTLAASATVKAMAVANGFSNSPVASVSFTVQGTVPQAAMPTITPSGGTITPTQQISITDTTAGASIYYTTDGVTTPTVTPSELYTGPFTLAASTTVQAVAVASGFSNSALASDAFTVQAAPPTINFASGFASSTGLSLNGGPTLVANRLRLTDGGTQEARSVFSTASVNVQQFTTDFSFQLTNPNGDGFTFTIQGYKATAVGSAGGELGYGPTIQNSVAVKFDLFNNAGEGSNSTGMYTNGAIPTVPATDLTPSGIDLHSGDIFNVHITYDGTTLTWTISDPTTGKSFTTSAPINIPSTVGGPMAMAGFTAATGGSTSTQEIISWTFTSQASTTKLPILYEAESIPATSSGGTNFVMAWAGFTDGVGKQLNATAAGNSITFTVNVTQAGSYDVRYAVKMHNSRGIGQLAINGSNLGPVEDQYAAIDAWKEFDAGSVTITTTGNQLFKFTVTGKNAASSGFSLAFDYIKLWPQ